ncbi:unnamed protein product [Merluccius merluccius]
MMLEVCSVAQAHNKLDHMDYSPRLCRVSLQLLMLVCHLQMLILYTHHLLLLGHNQLLLRHKHLLLLLGVCCSTGQRG